MNDTRSEAEKKLKLETRRQQQQLATRAALIFLGWCIVVIVFGLLLGA
jgi:hypothetical protein